MTTHVFEQSLQLVVRNTTRKVSNEDSAILTIPARAVSSQNPNTIKPYQTFSEAQVSALFEEGSVSNERDFKTYKHTSLRFFRPFLVKLLLSPSFHPPIARNRRVVNVHGLANIRNRNIRDRHTGSLLLNLHLHSFPVRLLSFLISQIQMCPYCRVL